MNLWPVLELVLCDAKLGLEVPLSVVVDGTLSFKPQDGMTLNENQVDEVVKKVCGQAHHAAIGVTDNENQVDEAVKKVCGQVHHAAIGVTETFGVLREYLSELMLRDVGEGDEEEERRLGKVIAIASYFDDGVDYLLRHWTGVVREAGKYLEREGDRGSADGPRAETATPSAGDIARCVKEYLDPDLKFIARVVKGTERNTKISSLRALHHLNLLQACLVLSISDTRLRASGLLNALNNKVFDGQKLNGHRKGSGLRAGWRFDQSEVTRFADVLRRRGW